MFKLFRQYVLGGESDKREAAWLTFAMINAVLFFAVYTESKGVAMPSTWAFLMVAWPGALAGVIGVHVQHFHASVKALGE